MKNILLFIAIALLTACGSEPSSPTSQSMENTGDKNSKEQAASPDQAGSAQAPEPGQSFATEETMIAGYGKLIAGEWEAVGDAGWHLKIEGNTIKQFKNNEQISSEPFTIHVKCNQGGCISQYFWCLATENSCYLVRRVDAKNLNLQLSNDGEILKFIKI
ncbi:MAG: hypothetical protein R2788_04580 [Saprospiraceae bacterium]